MSRLISFSGVDGAGKSTQIDALGKYLKQCGLRFHLLRFWNDVVVLANLREHMSLKAFKGDKGIGSPEKPIVRRDKNVQSWYMTVIRLALYTLDSLRTHSIISRSEASGADFVIFDRYIYDELANLPLQHKLVRLYVKFLLRTIRPPDVALLLDADPEAAANRKPEYPLEFVRQNRDAYLSLSRLANVMTIVPPLSVNEASDFIRQVVAEKCLQSKIGPAACPTLYSASSGSPNALQS
jgi:thymidylate kinase